MVSKGHSELCDLQTMEGGSTLTSTVLALLPVISNTGRGIGTDTCGMGDVFPTDDRWFGSETYTNCAVVCDLYLDV